jgi:uncharacterized membrane protein YgcG
MKNGAIDAAISEGAAAMLVTIDPTFNPTTKPDQTSSDASSSSGDDIGFWGYLIGWGVLLIALYIVFAIFMHVVAAIRHGYLVMREGKAAADKDMKRSWLNFFLFGGLASSSSTGGGFFSSGGFGGGGGGFSGGSFGGGFGGGGASGSW